MSLLIWLTQIIQILDKKHLMSILSCLIHLRQANNYFLPLLDDRAVYQLVYWVMQNMSYTNLQWLIFSGLRLHFLRPYLAGKESTLL